MEEHRNKRQRLDEQSRCTPVAQNEPSDGSRTPSLSIDGGDDSLTSTTVLSNSQRVHNSQYGPMKIAGKARVHNGDNTGIHHHHYNVPSPNPGLDADKTVFDALKASLVFTRMDARLRNVLPPLPKTCNWLFKQKEYLQWNSCSGDDVSDRFLWIKGKPGSGKSTIMKTAFNKASRRPPEDTVTISYFFNARAPDALEKSSLGLYRSIVHQVLRKCPVFEPVFLATFSTKYQTDTIEEWTENELQDFLVSVMQGLERPHLCLFIDALDEGEEDDVREMIAFLENLVMYAEDASPFRVCLSSRHYPHIHIKGLSLVVEDQSEHDQDIELYVRQKLVDAPDKKMDELRADLCSKSAGVFLWVVLVVPILNRIYEQRKGFAAMREHLERLPQKLEGLFAEIIERSSDEIQACVSLLQWVLFSTRPLTLPELYLAVQYTEECPRETSVDTPDEETLDKYILNCSRGLVECTKGESRVVQFIHETVRGFLLGANGLARIDESLSQGLEGRSHHKLGHVCWLYLRCDGRFESLKTLLEINDHDSGHARNTNAYDETSRLVVETTYPFMKYAVEGLLVHAEAAQLHNISQSQLLTDFQDNRCYRLWIGLRNLFTKYVVQRYDEKVTLLYITAEKGLLNLVKILAQQPNQVNVQCGRYGTALQAASFAGHREIVQCLLEHGADPDVEGGEYKQALAAAFQRGHLETAALLLRYNAKLYPRFHAKALLGIVKQNSEEGVQRLLDLGVDLSSVDLDTTTALITAIENEQQNIIELLLQHGVDINKKLKRSKRAPRDHVVQSALQFASACGFSSMVKLLLSNGAMDCYDPQAIVIAISSGFTTIRDMLSEAHYEYNLDARVEIAKAATRACDISIFRSVLGPAVIDFLKKPEEFSNRARFLTKAVVLGAADVVQILLEQGFEANTQTEDEAVAFYFAFKANRISIIELFNHFGTNLNTCIYKSDGSPVGNLVHIAAKNGDVQVMRALIAQGANFNAEFARCGTPLCAAASNGFTNIVKILLDCGATTDVGVDSPGPLFAASLWGYTDIVEALLNHGAAVDVGNCGCTPLFAAVCQGPHLGVIKLLIQNGAEVNCYIQGEGTLLQAVWKKCLDLLCKYGQVKDEHLGHPIKILLLLLKAGAGFIPGQGWDATLLQDILSYLPKYITAERYTSLIEADEIEQSLVSIVKDRLSEARVHSPSLQSGQAFTFSTAQSDVGTSTLSAHDQR